MEEAREKAKVLAAKIASHRQTQSKSQSSQSGGETNDQGPKSLMEYPAHSTTTMSHHFRQ